MILGHVRDNLPRVRLTLPGLTGPLTIEFIVDTGFDGELSLPASVLRQLDAVYLGDKPIMLADSFYRSQPSFEVLGMGGRIAAYGNSRCWKACRFLAVFSWPAHSCKQK